MANTSQDPGSAVGGDHFRWLFLRFDGRISREVYWLSIGLLWTCLFVLVAFVVAVMGQEAAGAPILMLGIASLWCEVAILVKRQHDRGLPWFWCLLAFVPIVGALWLVACGILKGDEGPNAYGPLVDTPPS